MTDILIICANMLLAVFLGGIIGIERESLGKPAGSRTYALIALGSALFTSLSIQSFGQFANADPGRLAGQIITGIGFIGAGMIIYHKEHVQGITSASALWATAAVGMAVGLGEYIIAIFTTIVIFILLDVVRRFEFHKHKKKTLWDFFKRM